ncbi:hypothetical protein G6F59_012449 [Rhizopus arrhizus]|nr:hypothetical protein G6F59_012449 [Rhizopus arrhizus]
MPAGRDVTAVLHCHGQADRFFAHEAHLRRGRVGKASLHLGDVTQVHGAVAGTDRDLAGRLEIVELAGHAQLHAIGGGLEEAGTGDRVLVGQRLLYLLHRHAQRRQAGIGQLDPPLLVLPADQVDLADVRHALQFQLDAVGVIAHHGVVEALAGQRVDVAVGVAELIVEERADDLARQRRPDVAHALAHLVPQVRNLPGTQAVAGHEDHLRFARARVRADELVLAGVHQRLLDRLGHLPRDLLGGGARPQRAHHHRLEARRRASQTAPVDGWPTPTRKD